MNLLNDLSLNFHNLSKDKLNRIYKEQIPLSDKNDWYRLAVWYQVPKFQPLLKWIYIK